MLLVSQVGGALAAGLLAWILARNLGAGGPRAIGAVAVVVIVAAALLSVPSLLTAVETFLAQRQANHALTPEEKRLQPGVAAKANVPFLSWVDERISSDETFRPIIGHPTINATLSQWVLFQLEPRLGVPSLEGADWIVFYDVQPSRYRATDLSGLEVFEPGYAIARAGVAG